ncbi:unnamed protein product, partial [marine sediment metagenome]
LALVVALAAGLPLLATRCVAQAVADPSPDEAASPDKAVSFAKQVAPVLVAQCMGCHGSKRPRAGLSMASFNRLMQGGKRGKAITAGNSADSLLIRKIRGMAGKRMPLERPALPAATIELFEAWIATGAKFDGSDPDAPLGRVVADARGGDVPDEVSIAQQAKAAMATWRLAIPDDPAERRTTDHFLLLGNVAESRLGEIGESAEKEWARVAKTLQMPRERPPWKGRLTVYVFANRYDFSEFGTMVEKR